MQYHNIPENNEVTLTVAMAIFNAEKYMRAAIDNVLTQTYQDFELLLIDDGSTDRSKEIAHSYELADRRVRCIYKKNNEGLSSVRNLSISEAKGKYLIMIDADDLMESNTLELAIHKAESSDSDIVIWDYDTFYDSFPNQCSEESRLKDIDVNDRKALLSLPAFMPVRLIKTTYARNANLQFPLRLTKQDIPVHWRMITDSNARISLISKKLFHYRQHPNTTSNQKDKSLFSLAKVMDIVGDQLKKDGLYNTYCDEYLRKRLILLHGLYDFISPEYKAEALNTILSHIDDDSLAFIASSNPPLPKRTRLFYRAIGGSITAKIQYATLIALRTIYRNFRFSK